MLKNASLSKVLTQEGWVDVMHDTMDDVNDGWRPLGNKTSRIFLIKF